MAAQQNKNKDAANNQTSPQSGSAEVVREFPQGRQDAMKVLAESSYGQVSEPFVAVTRDPRVYAALRRMVKELPVVDDDFFNSNTVVAVFTGLRNTGGYAIELTRSARGQLLISERVPPPDMMTTQALTKPFKIVAVQTTEDEDVSVVLQDGLAASMLRPYRVVSGEYMPDTGHQGTGRAARFALEGGLKMARYDELATLFFDVKGAGERASNVLQTAATGIVERGGRFFTLTGLDAATLAGRWSRRLRVTGRLTGDGEDRLELDFASSVGIAAGGRLRAGHLSAVASAPAPAKAQRDASMY